MAGAVTRLSWIDSLKGIAILFVVAIHCGSDGLPRNVARLVSTGAGWVQMFLLLTVVLACASYKKHLCKSQGLKKNNAKFWLAARFVRLAPLYYVALAGAVLLVGGMPCWLGAEGHVTGLNILAHVTFLHGLFPHYADSIIGVEWYIGVIAIVYLLYPCLDRWVSTLPRAFIGLVVSVLVVHLFLEYAMPFLVDHSSDSQVVSAYCGVFCPIASLPTVFLGMMLFFVLEWLKAVRWSGHERRLLAGALFVLFLLLYHGELRNENALHWIQPQLRYATNFFILIMATYLWNVPFVDNAVFRFFGRHCYGIYLFHMIIICLLGKLVAASASMFIISLSVSTAVTVVLERCFDAPVRRFLVFGIDKLFDREGDR